MTQWSISAVPGVNIATTKVIDQLCPSNWNFFMNLKRTSLLSALWCTVLGSPKACPCSFSPWMWWWNSLCPFHFSKIEGSLTIDTLCVFSLGANNVFLHLNTSTLFVHFCDYVDYSQIALHLVYKSDVTQCVIIFHSYWGLYVDRAYPTCRSRCTEDAQKVVWDVFFELYRKARTERERRLLYMSWSGYYMAHSNRITIWLGGEETTKHKCLSRYKS